MPSDLSFADILEVSFLDRAKQDILERFEFLTYIGVINELPYGQTWQFDGRLSPYFYAMPEPEEVDGMSDAQLELLRDQMRPIETAPAASESEESNPALAFAPFSFEFTFVDAIFHCIHDNADALDTVAGRELQLLKDHFNDLTATAERPPLDQVCQRVLSVIELCLREIVKKFGNVEANLAAAYQLLNTLLPGSCMHVLLLGCSHVSWGNGAVMTQISELRSKYYRLVYFFEIDHWLRPLEFDAEYNIILPQ